MNFIKIIIILKSLIKSKSQPKNWKTVQGQGKGGTAEPIEDDAEEQPQEEAHVEELEEERYEQQELDQELCVGLQNFPVHKTLLLLLLNGFATHA